MGRNKHLSRFFYLKCSNVIAKRYVNGSVWIENDTVLNIVFLSKMSFLIILRPFFLVLILHFSFYPL